MFVQEFVLPLFFLVPTGELKKTWKKKNNLNKFALVISAFQAFQLFNGWMFGGKGGDFGGCVHDGEGSDVDIEELAW